MQLVLPLPVVQMYMYILVNMADKFNIFGGTNHRKPLQPEDGTRSQHPYIDRADSKINHFFPLAQWMRIGGLGGDWGFALWGFALWSFLHFHFITSLYCCIEAVLNSLIVCQLPFISKTYWSFALWSSSSWSFSSSLVFGQIEPTASPPHPHPHPHPQLRSWPIG